MMNIRSSSELVVEASRKVEQVPECTEAGVTGEENGGERVRFFCNTGTFCCKACGVFDLNGYRNRLTPQLGGIAEDEEVIESDLVEEDAILGVLRKDAVVECFHCAQASEMMMLEQQNAAVLAMEEEAALMMLGELQRSMSAESEAEEQMVEEGAIVTLSDVDMEQMRSSVSVDNILDSFYSNDNEYDYEDEEEYGVKESKLSYLSGDDVDSFVASLVDLASDIDSASEGDASESRSLFDDLECESTRSASEYASVESASEKSVESENEAEQRETETRAETEKVIVALSDVKDGLSPLNGNAKGHGNGWFSKSSSLSTASTRADSFDESSISSSMGSSKSPRHLEVESEEVGYLRYSREGKMGLGLGDNISSNYRTFQMTPIQSSC